MLNITLNEARKPEKRVLKYLTSGEGDKKIFKTLPKKTPHHNLIYVPKLCAMWGHSKQTGGMEDDDQHKHKSHNTRGLTMDTNQRRSL